PTIVRAVKELEADIVVMGNSGKGALSSFVTGSVSQYVMHHVECPVTIVK
ncbi:universal stress protein, partial [Megamonas funiformis]